MASLTIGERTYDIAPYNLGELQQAAPHIDAMNSVLANDTLTAVLTNVASMLRVLSIGLQKVDASLTPEALNKVFDMRDMSAITAAFTSVMAEAGLAGPGEAQAPLVS